MNAPAILALSSIQEKSKSLDDLWTCLNIIEDHAHHPVKEQDSLVIHAAVMMAQVIARNMGAERTHEE